MHSSVSNQTRLCRPVSRQLGFWEHSGGKESTACLLVKSKTFFFFFFLPWIINSTGREKQQNMCLFVGDAGHWVTFFSFFLFQLLAVIRGRSSLRLRGTSSRCRFGICAWLKAFFFPLFFILQGFPHSSNPRVSLSTSTCVLNSFPLQEESTKH